MYNDVKLVGKHFGFNVKYTIITTYCIILRWMNNMNKFLNIAHSKSIIKCFGMYYNTLARAFLRFTEFFAIIISFYRKKNRYWKMPYETF